MAKPAHIRPLGESDFVRMMLVTGSGWGKTVFCGTAPKALFITTDPEGTISAKAFGSTAEEWKVDGWNKGPRSLMAAYEYMRNEGCKGFDWLIHDNVCEEQYICRGASIDARMVRKPVSDPMARYRPAQEDYLTEQNGIIEVTKMFRALPIHQIWTAWWKIVSRESADGEVVDFYIPKIEGKQGAVAEQMMGYMNIIGMGQMLEKDGKDVRRLWFTHKDPYRGKDRYNVLGRYKDNLTVPKMMELIEGGKSTRASVGAARTTTRRRVARKTA